MKSPAGAAPRGEDGRGFPPESMGDAGKATEGLSPAPRYFQAL